jgi:hypothetical protein
MHRFISSKNKIEADDIGTPKKPRKAVSKKPAAPKNIEPITTNKSAKKRLKTREITKKKIKIFLILLNSICLILKSFGNIKVQIAKIIYNQNFLIQILQ